MKLPLNCTVEYIENFLTKEEAEKLFSHIANNYDISNQEIKTADGKIYKIDTGKISFIDQELYEANRLPDYMYGKTAIWPEPLLEIRKRVEQLTSCTFGVGVCIYYPDGHSGVTYHSDPPAFGDTTIIPSLSLGEERVFSLKEKSTQKEHHIELANGSLIVMGENCQERYEHSLPTNPKYKNPRINITFRSYGFGR